MTGEKEIGAVASKLLGPWLDALTNRNAKNASRAAGHLTFWRDGMLGDLEKIAAGAQDGKTIASLKKKFADSAAGVTRAMDELRVLRGKLSPSKVAQQIDLILHNDQFGKGSIRDAIEMVLRDHELGGNRDGTVEFAADICRRIAALNGELQKLGRMVRN